MEKVCIYLRKSRADLEAEERGEGETLAKHKKALLKVAKQQNLNIVNIREEIASGESLMNRPQMLELLKEVEEKLYDAVLVMDMDRLGRGNMKEQGLILETFQESQTKIITPRKTYDLSDEFDEEYSEFEAFMARKELKIINRRLQGGRIRSVEEGNYLGTRPPYGYLIKKLDNSRTLEPHSEQAPIVEMIFNLYTEQMGTAMIANKLNQLGYKTYTGKEWDSSSILTIIKNSVYVGMIKWKDIKVQGKHEPIIEQETFDKAQQILKSRYHVPYQLINGITNPLAGLIKCGHCGASMVYRPYTKQAAHLICYKSGCKAKSTRFEYVENRLVNGLKHWLEEYKAQWQEHKPNEEQDNNLFNINKSALSSLQREFDELEKQKNRLHDLLERGIYDEETFLERSNRLAERINQTRLSIEETKADFQLHQERKQAEKNVIPNVQYVLDMYEKTDDAGQKNALLKTVLDKAFYRKEKHQQGDDFELVIYPNLV